MGNGGGGGGRLAISSIDLVCENAVSAYGGSSETCSEDLKDGSKQYGGVGTIYFSSLGGASSTLFVCPQSSRRSTMAFGDLLCLHP